MVFCEGGKDVCLLTPEETPCPSARSTPSSGFIKRGRLLVEFSFALKTSQGKNARLLFRFFVLSETGVQHSRGIFKDVHL